jgi:hypothetical protein
MMASAKTDSNDNSTVQHHTLDGKAFQAALERYVDENKPDPLVLKQIQAWEMEWQDKGEALMATEDLSFVPTDCLRGTLTWKGDYMTANVSTCCSWASDSKTQRQDFYFVLKASLGVTPDTDISKDETKRQDKIRDKMIQRLKEDTYIKKLLSGKAKEGASDNSEVLCEAKVSLQSNDNGEPEQLEERVDVTDLVAEGLRRALFSQAESSLDVIDVLLSLPLLPGSAHSLPFKCVLADRAKLRLLEDAMFDACEREGEDELIEDLNISPGVSQDDTPNGGGRRAKHIKAQQQNKSNKKTKR